jgi:FixJ family two-component response regulator
VPFAGSVAIIDDDEELRLSLGGLMRSSGIEARLFESADAFLATGESPFDCVIADVHMPGLDGISMIKRLRDRDCQVPVIIISALDPLRTREQAMAAGALAYFPKPVDSATLLELIGQLADPPRSGQR